MSGEGDCFPTAVRTAVELVEAGHPNVLVVHGLPVGRNGDVEGVRYWHAWVETLVSDQLNGKPTWAVADWSNGQQRIFIARKTFYRLGQVQQHLVWRFATDEVPDLVDQYGHVGPWHPKADELGDGARMVDGRT